MKHSSFRRDYQVFSKGYGGGTKAVGETMIIEMDSTDLDLLRPGKLNDYASPVNKLYAGWKIGSDGGERYWGKGMTSNAVLDKMLEDGWAEGAEMIQNLADEIRDLIPRPMGPRRRPKWGDHGDHLEMAKVYNGQLDSAWLSSPRQRASAPRVISIDADVGQNSNVSATALMWAGVAAVALTDALEGAGYRVELFSTSASNIGQRGQVLTRLVAKRAGEPLNPSLTAALVAHPASFRFYHLASWLKHPASLGWGFGSASAIPTILDAALQEGVIEGAEITLKESLSKEAAIREVTAAIKNLVGAEEGAEGTMV